MSATAGDRNAVMLSVVVPVYDERATTPCVVDGRNLSNPASLRGAGFEYLSVSGP